MIELHEEEHSNTALSDLSMRRVALLLGPECATKLLYAGDKYVSLVRLDPTRDRPAPEKWIDGYDDSGPFDIWHTPVDQESETVAPVEEVSALDRVG